MKRNWSFYQGGIAESNTLDPTSRSSIRLDKDAILNSQFNNILNELENEFIFMEEVEPKIREWSKANLNNDE